MDWWGVAALVAALVVLGSAAVVGRARSTLADFRRSEQVARGEGERAGRLRRRRGWPCPPVPDPRERTPLDGLARSEWVRRKQLERNEEFARAAGAADGWHAEDRERPAEPSGYEQVLRLDGAEVVALRQLVAALDEPMTRAERSLARKAEGL